MKKIVYTQPDGTVAVCTPAEGARLAHGIKDGGGAVIAVADTPVRVDQFLRRWPVEGVLAEWAETEDEFVARIAAKDAPAGATDVQIVDAEAVPTDRTFRNAWKAGNKRVDHNIDKCKTMAHEKRREKRDAEFKPHDEIIMKKIPGKDASAAETARAVIRAKYDEMQAAIDAAASVDEIKAALS